MGRPVVFTVGAAAARTGYGWLTFAHMAIAWWISAIAVNIGLFVLGWHIYENGHECKRREVSTCVQCEKHERAASDARKSEDQVRQIALACVFRSQQDLDEILAIFGERVQKLCEAETPLNEKEKRVQLPPREHAELERLRSEINRYRRAYAALREQAPKFALYVAEGWSTYFPDRPHAA